MGGNYEKGVHNQLMDVMAKLNTTESEHREDHKEVNELTFQAENLRKENSSLREESRKLQ